MSEMPEGLTPLQQELWKRAEPETQCLLTEISGLRAKLRVTETQRDHERAAKERAKGHERAAWDKLKRPARRMQRSGCLIFLVGVIYLLL